MKKSLIFMLLCLGLAGFVACTQDAPASGGATASAPDLSGQSGVSDDVSQKDIVKVAVGSKDHTTLVAAVKAAELVDALSNVGPLTVFAPTNAAFEALPAGTVEGLLKPEKKADLQNILQYHVLTSSLKADFFRDGQTLGTVAGPALTFHVKDGKVMVNDATIIASVPASNGMVHVIDKVLLPPSN